MGLSGSGDRHQDATHRRVSQSGSTPVFQYFRYYQSTDPKGTEHLGTLYPTPLTTPLKATEAVTTAAVTVSFTVDSGIVRTPKATVRSNSATASRCASLHPST